MANFLIPAGLTLANTLVEALIQHGTDPKQANAAVAQTISDPIVKNASNSEPIYQSRVAVGAASGFLGSVAVIVLEATTHQFPNYDWVVLGPALVAVWGTAYAFYGRVKTGLAPLFAKKA